MLVVAVATGCNAPYPATSTTTTVSPAAGPGIPTAPRTSLSTPTPTPTAPALPRLLALPATAAPSPRTDSPVRFAVPAVRLDLRVVAIGVAADGLLSLPPDPADIGWYEYGPTTGARAGSTLLAGHLDSLRYGLGPLVRLRDVRRGDAIAVTTASGRVDRYRASDVQRVRKAGLVGLGVFNRSGPPLLRIVTCGGPFDPSTGYRDNLVVTASPAD